MKKLSTQTLLVLVMFAGLTTGVLAVQPLTQSAKGKPVKPTPTATPTPIASTCARPYTDASPWNTRITNPIYHPLSDSFITALSGTFGSNPDSYTYPVYQVTSTTPVTTIKLSGTYSDVQNSGTTVTRLSAPTLTLHILASAQPSAGNDAQIILINTETGDEWGLYEAAKQTDGTWTATNGYHYNTNWSGVPPAGFGSRGAGVTYLAGLIRKCEVDNGVIDHAIAFGYDYACTGATCAAKGLPAFVYPATKTDGRGTYEFDIPEGARLQLKPDATDTEITSWCTGDSRINEQSCRIVVRALQDYGMILIDNSGHPKIYPENTTTAQWGTTLNSYLPSRIPYTAFRVIGF